MVSAHTGLHWAEFSTCSMVTSWAALKEVALGDICTTASLSALCTFARFFRPLHTTHIHYSLQHGSYDGCLVKGGPLSLTALLVLVIHNVKTSDGQK